MRQEITLAGESRNRGTGMNFAGMDFASTTWHAVRGLLAGQNVYTDSTRIAGVMAWPAGEHVPATLSWQAPFAALPLWAGFFAFDFVSIAAIWAAVFILTRPRSPLAILGAACCGAFAIILGGGTWTLILGQPPAFELLGVALLVRSRRPWVGALGFLLAASTFQTGVPLAVMLVVLSAWPVVWRGALLVAALSVPPIVLGVIATGGLVRYTQVFSQGAFGHLAALPGEPLGYADQPHRIDLGALLHRVGISSAAVQVGAGLLVLAVALIFLTRLPAALRRLDYPPVLCLVMAVTILCTYHQPYDLLLVAGAVVPVVLMAGERSMEMLGIVAAAGISVAVFKDAPVAAILDPVCLLAMATLSALAARQGAARLVTRDSQGPMNSELTSTGDAVADGLVS